VALVVTAMGLAALAGCSPVSAIRGSDGQGRADARPSGPPAALTPTIVSLTFDDGLVSQYALRGLLYAHHLHATFFINSHNVDIEKLGVMTWSQIHDLAADGHEIGGHTLTHVSLTDPRTTFDSKWRQTCEDRARLQAQGFDPVSFAYPFGDDDAAAEKIVRGCGYQSGRTSGALLPSRGPFAETVPPRDPFGISVLGTTDDGPITRASLQTGVEAAYANGGGWLPLVFHGVCDPDAPGYSTCMHGYRPVDLEVLNGFVAWLVRQSPRGVEVKDVADVVGAGGVRPLLAVTGPGEGAGTSITGTDSWPSGQVTVSVYRGRYSTGHPDLVLRTSNDGGTWRVPASGRLPRGTYTVQASQKIGTVTGFSVPVTFGARPTRQ
jgi:peptidoglycan/xylan/chitin deacetylase (PgdA/CDA1 family)